MKGTLEQAGSRWRLRFTRDLDHPVPRVWRAMTEPGDLEAWFPLRITGDWAVGGPLTFSDPQGRGPDFSGEVIAYEPPALLEFCWGPDMIRLEVEARGHGLHPHAPAHVRRTRQGSPGRGWLARVPGDTGPRPGWGWCAAGQPLGTGPPGLREFLRPGSLQRRGPAGYEPAKS